MPLLTFGRIIFVASPPPLILLFFLLVAGTVLLLTARLFSPCEADTIPIIGQARTVNASPSLFGQRPKCFVFAFLQKTMEKSPLVPPVVFFRPIAIKTAASLACLYIDTELGGTESRPPSGLQFVGRTFFTLTLSFS